MGPLRICFLLVTFGFLASAQITYKCNFEYGICDFLANSRTNSENWKIGKGKLKSGETGPSVDHTYGKDSGSYVYVDMSKAKKKPVALETQTYKRNMCVKFFYHMYGADVGKFQVSVRDMATMNAVPYFQKNGTQGDRWKEAHFSTQVASATIKNGFKILFVATGSTTSSTALGDIALDDIELLPGKCPDSKHDAFELCSFDEYDCGYTAHKTKNLKWERYSFIKPIDTYKKTPASDHTLGTSIGGYWLVGDKGGNTYDKLEQVSLISPEYPTPKEPISCLHFYFHLNNAGKMIWYGGTKEAFVQVFLNFPSSSAPRRWVVTKALNTTIAAQWNYVEAQLDIKENFQLQFVGGLMTPVEAVLAIDDVKLINGRCPEAGSCDFEENKCSWVDSKEDYSWIRKQPSSWSNKEIGPPIDHTKGTEDGTYLVFNTNSKAAGSKASLESEFIPPMKEDLCLTFYYFMQGENLGTLKVMRQEENITEATLWVLKGPQKGLWNKATVRLNPSMLYNQVKFIGITGTGTNAYMALDDIRMRKGEKCELLPREADPRYDAVERLSCTFDDLNMCLWKQDPSTLNWKLGNGTLFESTGPKEPLNGQGHYIFISYYEDGFNNKVARIISPSVPSFYPETACFSFYYHMFGAHVGELRVVLVPMKEENTPLGRKVIWRRRGTQPDKWIQFRDSLNMTEGDYRIEIEAEGGVGFAGDIAIDDILMSFGACPNVDMCDFESSLCGWKIEANKDETFYWERGYKMPKGPKTDHTTLTDGGYYLQAVAEKNVELNDATNLVSPVFGSRWGPHCLTFWYHRAGLGTGNLKVLTRDAGQENLEWSNLQDLGPFWHFGQVNVNAKSSLQLVIQAMKGDNNDNEMAIDDVLIKNSKCEDQAKCTFNNDYCSYSQNATSDFAWLLGTGRVVNTQLIDNPPVDNRVENGMYVYADMTSPSIKPNQRAVLVSEILEGSSQQVMCFKFYFFVSGKKASSIFTMGRMVFENLDKEMQYKISEEWEWKDGATKGWIVQAQSVAVRPGERFQIYYAATKLTDPSAFIAIDDITANEGRCEAVTTLPPPPVTEMPYSKFSCDFDNGTLCDWKYSAGRLRWEVNEPGQFKDMMPKFDHTQGNFLGRYSYVIGDGRSVLESQITSPPALITWKGNFCFSFWFMMNVGSNNENRLRVDAENKAGGNTGYYSYWSRMGNYGYKWRHAYVHINSAVTTPRVSMVAYLKTGVIAVDDIAAKEGSCPPTKMCTFDDDDDMCGYTQDSKNYLNWDVKSGADNDTMAAIVDHTTQSVEGKYLYLGVDGKSKEKFQKARIFSPKRLPSPTASCVTFYYHIHNVSKLTLNTYVSTANGVSDPQWSVSIGQGLLWHGARFSVASGKHAWQILFEVEVGDKGYGQVAIDDINVDNGACDDPGYCDFEDDNCLWENVRPPTSLEADVKRLNIQNADVKKDLLKDDYDWVRHIGEDYFGPMKDHTRGTPQGFYLLLDTKEAVAGQKAVYMSERFRSPAGVCLKMWYATASYPNGATLKVYVSSDFKKANELKVVKKPTHDIWTEELVTVLPPISADSAFSDFWIFLEGQAGNHTLGYIAIDDISVQEGSCEERIDLFDCLSGQFVLATDVCNFKKDCKNGYDERECADCDFQSDSCGWTTKNKFDFFRFERTRAGSGILKVDNTRGDSTGYYVEASALGTWLYYNTNAEMNSEVLRDAFSTCSMTFYYHVKNKVDFKVILERGNKRVDLWIPPGNSDDLWTKAEVFLGRIPRTFKLNFFAKREKGVEVLAAIDDIAMIGCETLNTGGTGVCSSDQFDCKNSRCISKDNICDYTDDCGNFEDEKPEMCVTAISRCSFDQSFCDWISVSSAGAAFQLMAPFQTLQEGPTRDHTSGFSNGKFLYLPGRVRPSPARLFGPVLQPVKGCQIRFYYDIRTAGTFYLQIKTKTEQNGEEKVVYSREDPTEGYFFVEDRYTFKEKKFFQVIIEASITVGEGRVNYIALDDISFNYKCVPLLTPLPTVEPVVSTVSPIIFCRKNEFRCNTMNQCIPMDQKCNFRQECADGSDEDHCGACDFHQDMCGLVNKNTWAKYKWQRAQAEEFSQLKNSTAPDADSTGDKQGYFAVLTGKTSSQFGTAAVMRTVSLGEMSHACTLQFHYHFNIRGGSLAVYVNEIGVAKQERKYLLTQSSGKNWQFVSVPLGNNKAGKWIEFEGNTQYDKIGGKVQDMAIDNIKYINCDPEIIYNKSISCNFDVDECGWFPDTEVRTATWIWAKKAPLNHVPQADHTGKGGSFMYVKAGNRYKQGTKAHMVSLKQNPSEKRCFSFWYHMYGPDVGTLNIIIREESGNETTIWSKKDSQGNAWKQGMRTIRQDTSYKIIIEGIIGGYAKPIIAIDDVEVAEEECPHPFACDFDADFCEWDATGWVLQIGKGNKPAKDHTTDTETGRYAALVEETGRLVSPEYNFTNSDYCLNFWYFAQGGRDTFLRVQREEEPPIGKPVSVWTEFAEPKIKGQWRHSKANVPDLSKGDYHVVIYGEKKSNAYLAVDDLAIETDACPLPGSCTFERDFCTWRHLSEPISSGLRWLRNSGHIDSFTVGPKADHTTGSSDGWYIYLDSQFGDAGKTAVLESENLHYAPEACFKFWYHMTTDSKGAIEVSYVDLNTSRITIATKISGYQGNTWYPRNKLVKNLPEVYRVRLKGIQGTSGYIAIDDVSFQPGSCDDPITTTPPPTEFPPSPWDCSFETNDFCSWIQGDAWVVQDGRKALETKQGPSADHTKESTLGRYAYYKPLKKNSGGAELISAKIDLENSDYCLRFWYYMHSVAPVSLQIHALQYDMLVGPLWVKKTSSGTNWKYGTYYLEKSVNMSIVFKAQQQKVGVGDIALDDIMLNAGSCPIIKGKPCDFESADICGFKISTKDGVLWRRVQAKSLKKDQSGPRFDKTYQTYEGHYMLVRPSASGRVAGDNKALLIMPNVPSTGPFRSCVRFWYQMTGENVISLNLYMRPPGGDLPQFPLWSHGSKHGNDTWRIGQRTIDANYVHEIVFEAVMERGDDGFIALDDIVVKEGGCPPPGSCTFEEDLCSWQNAESNVDLEWVRNSGPTPTLNTGPEVDHTIGTGSGSYIYLQGQNSENKRNLVGVLQSEFFSLSTDRCLSFWAHMSGKEMGTLLINLTYYDENQIKTLNEKSWNISGDQGPNWFNRLININPSGLDIHDEYQIDFVGITKGALSDIALDDIEVTNGKCYDIPDYAFDCRDGSFVNASQVCDFEADCKTGEDEAHCGACDFEQDECGWREVTSGYNLKWKRVQAQDDDGNKRGPGVDHTFDSPTGSFMMSENKNSWTWIPAVLQSPLERFKKSYASCYMIFYYAFQKGSKASLRVKKRLESFTEATVWEQAGFPGEEGWQKGVAYLSTTERAFFVEFAMESSEEYTYVAIDDIMFENCNMPEARNSCTTDEFICSNGRCVSKYYLCDLTDDCGDRSDEAASICSKYPKPCTFDNLYDDCEWTVKGKGNNYWRAEAGRATRGYLNKGPLVDHSKGINGMGRYLSMTKYFTDKKYTKSFYHSPNYKISNKASYCSLRFYYYMHGSEDAYIKVYTEEEQDGWNWQERFREFGSLGQMWNRAIINIRTRQPFHFIIEGFPGNNSSDRVAIDDLSLSDGCQAYTDDLPTPLPTPLPTKSLCTDKEFKCISGKPFCIPKSKFCDFTVDCSDGSDEAECGPCNFEKDFCGWKDESAGLYTWTRKNASVDDGFGPKTDSKNSNVGWYAYVKEWSGLYSRAALLVSPPLPPVSTHCVMAFWLFVTRGTSGNLYVEHKPPTSLASMYTQIWSLPKSFKKTWQLVEVKIPGTGKKGSSIRFNSLPTWGFFTSSKNVAIDDIQFLYCNPKELMVDCDFDDDKFNGGFCHWTEKSDNLIDLKWKRGKGSTAKNFTGPTSDHTTGHGYYLYLDSQYSSPFYTARLESPLLPMNLPLGNCFSFWYHMYGTHVGTLSVRAMTSSFYNIQFLKSRTQGNKWLFAQIYIKASRDHQITIFGETSFGKEHNIAIDDIKMVDGICPKTPLCDFESPLESLCGWNSTFEGLSGWERVQGSGNWSEEKPSKDHTTNSENGYFLNLPFKRRGDLARLESPLYKNYGDMCVKFWYSMFGSDIGTLAVYQRTKQEGRLDNLKNLWKRSGDHSGSWKMGRVTMNSLPEFYIAIEAQLSNGPIGYISLDDVEVIHGKCSEPVSCTFEIDTCGWRNSEAFSDFQWVRRTGSDENIGDGPVGDHTTGSIQGHYMYALLTGAKKDEQSMLLSEDLEIYPNYCLSLWYNMYNVINSTLNVRQLIIGMGWEDVRIISSDSVKSGKWKRLETNITTEPAGDFFQLGITAFAMSDIDNVTDRGMAIDDLSLSKTTCGQKIPTTTVPPPTTTEYPPSKFDCDFENGYCLWENDPEITDAKWDIKTGHSDRRLTRPRTDHSLLSSSGHYLSLSDSAKSNYFAKAILRSMDGIDASEDGVCFKFWYHINGNNPGTLTLKTENFHDDLKKEVVWSQYKSQGPDWKYVQVHIARTYAFKLVIEGDGTQFGDVSLDDFSLNYKSCPPRHFCDVETDYCGFTHDPKSDIQWHRGNGSRTNGPDIDHTTNSMFGNYFYVDRKSSLKKGRRARLESRLYQPDKRCMQFWYYLNGIDVGTLEVLVRNGDTTTSKWKETGDNSQFWHGSEVVLTKPFVTPYSYIFQVNAGSNFSNGIIAIDDIEIRTECPPLGSCNFEDGMCLWNNDPTADIQWIRGSGEVTDAAPENDTTLGNQFGTYLYAHVLNTWKATPTAARLISPYFSLTSKRCINYWNYRNGTDFNGALTVSVYIDALDEITEIQHFTNEKLGRWNNEQVEVSDRDEGDANGKFQIIFEAQLTETKNNFIALDDINVLQGECILIEDRKPEFTCDDGQTHISSDFYCDFYEDCKDGTDEKYCGTHCDFENEEPDPCNWKTSPGGATWNQTLANGTVEPNIDHSIRNPGEGYYMKAVFGRFIYNGEAHMNGPALIQSAPTCRMFFWYYFNALVDTEALYIYYDAGHVSKKTELFRLEGERRRSWLLGEVVIGRINNRFRVGIAGKKESVTGVIAIDDINFENCDMPRQVIDPKPCKDQEFQCGNGNCIPNSLLCDFVDDCGDNSDENNRIGPKCDQYPGRCDFEGFNYCGWQRGAESDYSWEITQYSNDWYYNKKLVTRDHTRNSASGVYMYFSNSYRYKGQVARLASKVIEATNKDCSFRFFYTYGRIYNTTNYDEMKDIGTLTVYLRRDEVNAWKTLFIAREPPGQYYEKVVLPLEDYKEDPFEVIIESRIGSTPKEGGWAVDDISFSSGCTVSNKTLPLSIVEPTDTPDESCDIDKFTCLLEKKCIDLDKVCDFVPDCSDASDESKCGTCSFDEDWNPTCGWFDARGNKWKRNKGAKGSNGLVTDVSGNGYYMYVDKQKSGAVSSLATLRSVDFKQSSASCEISFYYFMSGIMNSDASLKLQLQTKEKHDVLLWIESSDQGRKWINTTASIGRREEGWHLDFISTHVLSKGDVAIDEINFLGCAPPEKRKCLNKMEFACFSGECINSSLVCDFSPDCFDGSDEDNCTSYMERCDFEKDLCTWEQDNSSKQKWVRTSGKKLAEGTGPDRDHTLNDETGHFLLAEKSYSWTLPRIISTAFMADTSGNCKIRFWYHLYYSYSTKIVILMNYQDDNRFRQITTLYGTDGDVWDRAEITLNSKFNFHVAIDGSPTYGNKGDVAIDDISFTLECVPVYTIITTPVPTIQPKGVCDRKGLFTCEDNSCIPWDVICDFKKDCSYGLDEKSCPSFCDFELGSTCGWKAITKAGDGLEINVTIAEESEKIMRGAPSVDKTTNSSKGSYLLIHSTIDSETTPSDDYVSPTFVSSAPTCKFSFWISARMFSMEPKAILVLESESIDMINLRHVAAMKWVRVEFGVGRQKGNFSLKFNKKGGMHRWDYIAIDDIEFVDCALPKRDPNICLGYRCKETKACIDYDRVCDLTDDCGDGTDEANCTEQNFITDDFERGFDMFELYKHDKLAPATWEMQSGPWKFYFTRRTGAPFDHTLSNSEGRYLVMSKRLNGGLNERAWLISDVLRSVSRGECQMRFFYYMHGFDVNELNVYTIKQQGGNFTKVFTQTGAVGNFWTRGTVKFQDTAPFQVIFEGKTGVDYSDAIALDDISFTTGCRHLKGETLPPKDDVIGTRPITAQPPTDCQPGEFFCKDDKVCISGNKKCDFRADCKDKSDEAECVKPKCDFENGDLCGWEIDHKWKQAPRNMSRKKRQAEDDHAFKWIAIQAKNEHTQINKKYLPLVDHTYNSSEGWYLLADGAPGVQGDTTSLISPKISATHTQCALDFWIFRGRDYARVIIYAGPESKMQKLWVDFDNLSGFSGTGVWEHAKVPLGSLTNYKVKFEATRPVSYISVTGLDDITFLDCEPPLEVNPEETICDGGQFMCGNNKCIADNLLCDYSDDCTDFSDEKDVTCQAYVGRCNFENACKEWTFESHKGGEFQVISPGTSKYSGLPLKDHTTNSENGKFVSVTSYYTSKDVKPKIRSQTIDGYSTDCKVRFWYNTVNYPFKINLYKRTSYKEDGMKFMESFSSDVSFWNRVEVPVFSKENEDFQIVIEAELYSRYGSVNIDDLSLTPGCHYAKGRDIPGKPTIPPPINDCAPEKLACRNGECYTHLQHCNFIRDCADGTDEDNCGTSCDFENGTCGWFNPPGYYAAWEIDAGKNRYFGNLRKDHTLGTVEGHFLMAKNKRSTRDVAQVHTQTYVQSNTNCKFSMWYFLDQTYGAKLHIILIRGSRTYKYLEIWNVTKDTGVEWQNAVVDIGLQENFGVILQASFGSSYLFASIAVDDIEFLTCSPDHPPVECSSDEWMCSNEEQCIKVWAYCDGKYDCNDKSDEYKCQPQYGDCNFDTDNWKGDCEWESKAMDFEWSRAKEGRSKETGPKRNQNPREDGYFLFIDSSKHPEGTKAGVLTPIFKPSDGLCHLRFWYYMYGSPTLGTLEVRVEGENGQSFVVWMERGLKVDNWLYAHTVVGSDQNYKVAFIGTVGGDDKTDIAIDEVKFTHGCKDGGIAVIPTGDTVYCTRHQFRCKNGMQCIPGFHRCDCAVDCEDGSDEINCRHTCASTKPPNEWTTLPTVSDRPPVSVLPQKECKKGEKLCSDQTTCIPGLLLCDGIQDCPDGSDETDSCGNANLCGEGLFFCNDHTYPPCLRRDMICNNKTECSDGSDESLCNICPKDFCKNGGNCTLVNNAPVCTCKEGYAQNRCGKLRVIEDLENKPQFSPAGIGWIIGLVIGTLLLIAILFVIWYMKNTNAERSRLTHAVDNPVYGLNLDTLTFGELNSHMPIRHEDGAGSTAIENPLYSFKSGLK